MAGGQDLAVFNREQVIADIKMVMRRLKVTHCLHLLNHYGLPATCKIGKFYEDYLPRRLEVASDHQLAALNSILAMKYARGSHLAEKYAQLNEKDQFRFFISHSATQAEKAQDLKQYLEYGGFDCFVAGDDIATASEWLVEIITQLEHMDGLISLVTDSSIESPTCNQEVGFALGAGKPVLSVMKDVPPQGLVGALQAIEWQEEDTAKDAALSAIEALMRLPHVGPKLTSLLVKQLVTYDDPDNSFKVIGFCRKALQSSTYLQAWQLFELRKAARENPEIARFASGRGPELIETLAQELEDNTLSA